MKKSELKQLIRSVINEVNSAMSTATKTYALQIDDANISMTEEELYEILPKFGIEVLRQVGEPNQFGSEQGHSTYYKLIISGTDQNIDKFISEYPEGIDLVDAGNLSNKPKNENLGSGETEGAAMGRHDREKGFARGQSLQDGQGDRDYDAAGGVGNTNPMYIRDYLKAFDEPTSDAGRMWQKKNPVNKAKLRY